MDQVYMKKYIKSEAPFENHPNLIYGIIMAAFAVLVVLSVILLWGLPFIVLVIIWAAAATLLIYWVVKQNEKTNLTKSSAFVKRDDKLYYIRLGYSLDNEIPVDALDVALMGVEGAVNAARAQENMAKTKTIQTIRDNPQTFSNYLTKILTSAPGSKMPAYVIEFCPMSEPKLESETKDWIEVSYINMWTGGDRKKRKFRNVYGTEMFD